MQNTKTEPLLVTNNSKIWYGHYLSSSNLIIYKIAEEKALKNNSTKLPHIQASYSTEFDYIQPTTTIHEHVVTRNVMEYRENFFTFKELASQGSRFAQLHLNHGNSRGHKNSMASSISRVAFCSRWLSSHKESFPSSVLYHSSI